MARLAPLFAVTAVVLGAASAVSLAACGKDERAYEDPAAVGFGTDAGAGLGEGGRAPLAECEESTRDPYVITQDHTLYQFHPPDLTFTNRGIIACPTGGAQPTSMAIDRQGIAWVRHSDRTIWKVSTKTLQCEATAWQPPEESFGQFGMGFSSETKGSSNEVLFLSDTAGAGLGRIDTGSFEFRFVGKYTGALSDRGSELTGTGDGKLYGFFTTSPAQIAEISKGTGAIVDAKELAGVNAGDAWAFSFYGGDFYVYTAVPAAPGGPPLATKGSTVTRYRPSDGSVTVVKDNLGFTIVGAGVSTCAPTTLVR